MKPTADGTVPVRTLSDACKYRSPVSFPIEEGMVPRSRKFVFTFSVFRLLKLPSVDGSTPENEFVSNTSEVRVPSLPMDGEIVPTTPPDDTSTAVTSTPLQLIPVQLHTAVSGT